MEVIGTLGERLRWHRLAMEMRLTDVATAVEISPSTVSRWENDLLSPQIVQLRLLARVLCIPDYWNLAKNPGEA